MTEAAINGSSDALETPVLLLAMPQVIDPFFRESVILLLHHTDEGSLGFIVNRPTRIKIGEVLEGLEIDWQGQEDLLAYFGGPVEPQLGTVIYGVDADHETPAANGSNSSNGSTPSPQIAPGMAMTQHLQELAVLAGAPPEFLRLFLGYAGWGDGQLVREIMRNDWLTAPVDPNLVFESDPEEVWRRAIASVGIDPAALPSWTPNNEDGATN